MNALGGTRQQMCQPHVWLNSQHKTAWSGQGGCAETEQAYVGPNVPDHRTGSHQFSNHAKEHGVGCFHTPSPKAQAGFRRNIQWQAPELLWQMPAQNHTPAEPLDQVAQIHKDRSSNGRVQPAEIIGSPGREHPPSGLSRRRPRLI